MVICRDRIVSIQAQNSRVGFVACLIVKNNTVEILFISAQQIWYGHRVINRFIQNLSTCLKATESS